MKIENLEVKGFRSCVIAENSSDPYNIYLNIETGEMHPAKIYADGDDFDAVYPWIRIEVIKPEYAHDRDGKTWTVTERVKWSAVNALRIGRRIKEEWYRGMRHVHPTFLGFSTGKDETIDDFWNAEVYHRYSRHL